MCPKCEDFNAACEIRSPAHFEQILAELHAAVAASVLLIERGTLDRADHIDCQLACASCRQAFELTCETYHGRGGLWRPVIDDDATHPDKVARAEYRTPPVD
jgi:hypothetical protein